MLAILRELVSPHSIIYSGDVKMIDIEEEVKERFEDTKRRYEAQTIASPSPAGNRSIRPQKA